MKNRELTPPKCIMKTAARATVLTLIALVASALESPAQVAYDSPNGRVELLGLRRWTLDMLRDSIRRYVPGQELHDAACMVTLRDSLRFARAYPRASDRL